jgi:hypothetical protein
MKDVQKSSEQLWAVVIGDSATPSVFFDDEAKAVAYAREREIAHWDVFVARVTHVSDADRILSKPTSSPRERASNGKPNGSSRSSREAAASAKGA